MTASFARSFDALGGWRSSLESRVREVARFLREHDLLDGPIADQLESLRARFSDDKLVVAFVAEFSRGKSELINAIFFADSGRRILPAAAGRTTMCPVELAWDAEEPPSLALLPVETRLGKSTLGELRTQPRAWTRLPLDPSNADGLAEAMQEVTRTRYVTLDEAQALGFWDDDRPDDNPQRAADGRVEVPAWRHALINLPHPLLKRGLVVIDTPGLNAIGAEPELTLGLLPSAHATLFVLGADTGVTRSDLAIWRDHLDGAGIARFVALNKIDALADPLSPPEVNEAQILRQCEDVARTLELPIHAVYPVSARQALAARVEGDAAGLERSRLPVLEHALAEQLLPARRELLAHQGTEGFGEINAQVQRRLTDRRRQLSEQLLELRGLRGKNSAKVRLMLNRIEAETSEFEQCIARLQAMRAVHSRMLKDALLDLGSDRLRADIDGFEEVMRSTVLQIGSRKAFAKLCAQLRERLAQAQVRGDEIHQMLEASFAKLNAEYGFSLAVSKGADLSRFMRDLDLIERNYVQYLGLGQALKLTQLRQFEQFRRMLISRLRVVFESAAGELELWNKTASAQIDSQLRDRRRGFKRRREALERIQGAAGELESRLAELESQDMRLQLQQRRLGELVAAAKAQANARPGTVVAMDKGFADTTPVSLIDLPIGEDEPSVGALRA
ncbi:dynamin family protein [Rivibacter subsaxonicus]|uniref:Dynamin family protein n=1 Tax=Rivibacter subsaxonicus TaxID=457575 RepID=A0A4Q7VGA8_9BURK|nr:dynamin family protein [Rivibacter subsaxonicus]RZT95049.1 dynamin family protein [Rivibacter subsaxonicus]